MDDKILLTILALFIIGLLWTFIKQGIKLTITLALIIGGGYLLINSGAI